MRKDWPAFARRWWLRRSILRLFRAFSDAEPRLLRLGDTPELQQADAAFAAEHRRPASREGFAARAAAQAARFAGRPPPDRGASLLDWYAWSLAARPHR